MQGEMQKMICALETNPKPSN